MKLTRKKKILLLIIASMVAAVGLDMAIARSLYHPLNYLYGILSWTSCQLFPCYPQQTEAVKGERGMINYPDLLSRSVWVFSSPEVIKQVKLNIFNRSF